MARGDTYVDSIDALADSSNFLIEGSPSDTGAAEVAELGGSGSADLYREHDPDGDGTWAISVLVDSFTGQWHSQQNGLVVSTAHNTRLRLNNTSGGSNDYYAIGIEIKD